jgi:hypothetical protein
VFENPFFDETAYRAAAPRTLAIAPLTNSTRNEEAARVMRAKLYGQLAPLGYDDVELTRVDETLSGKAARLKVEPENLHPYYVAEPDLADAVLLAQIERVGRSSFLFWTRTRVDLRVMLVDTRTRRKLYQNHYVVRSREFYPPWALGRIFGGIATTVGGLHGEALEAPLTEAALHVARRFPAPDFGAATGATYITNVEVSVPRPTLAESDRVVLRVTGAAGRKATFSIGDASIEQPMSETSPGQYSGVYEVRARDDAEHVFATVKLIDPDDAGEYVIVEASDRIFSIDTIPPVPYEVESWQQAPGRPGITLRFSPENRQPMGSEEAPRRFIVYRGEADAPALSYIGSTESNVFADTTAEPGVKYEYAVIAEDRAGNRSQVRSRLLVTPSGGGGSGSRR